MNGRRNRTERTRFTRKCIGDGILELMSTREFHKIRVSDVARRTGVSRMTFYHYYDTVTDALQDYLSEMISHYLTERNLRLPLERPHEYSQILFALNFFDGYADFFLKLNRAGLYTVIINAVNRFMLDNFAENRGESPYGLYFYAGALLNTFLKWEENGKKETADEVAEIICRFLGTIL